MRRTTYCLLAFLLIACGQSGRATDVELVSAYLGAAEEGDGRAVRGLYATERDGPEIREPELRRAIEEKLDRYAPLKDANFQVSYVPSEIVGYFCSVRIVADADPQFVDDLELQLFGNHWAILPGGPPTPLDAADLARASDESCHGARP